VGKERECVLKLISLNKAVQIYNAHAHIYGIKKLSYWCSFILQINQTWAKEKEVHKSERK